MRNAEIVRVFKNIAALLELKGENPFKIRAYQQAAFTLEKLPEDLTRVVWEGRLREVSGVGEAIAAKITELVTTGHLKYYEELKAGFPEGIITLLSVPGIGPRTAVRLNRDLGINSIDELEAAICRGEVASLSHIGEKTAESILRHIQSLKSNKN